MALADIIAVIDNKPYDVAKQPRSYGPGCMMCGDNCKTRTRLTLHGIPSFSGTMQYLCKECGKVHNRFLAPAMALLWLM